MRLSAAEKLVVDLGAQLAEYRKEEKDTFDAVGDRLEALEKAMDILFGAAAAGKTNDSTERAEAEVGDRFDALEKVIAILRRELRDFAAKTDDWRAVVEKRLRGLERSVPKTKPNAKGK